MSTKMCAFPKCRSKSGEFAYCKFHNQKIRDDGLCYTCLAVKEDVTHKVCQKCHYAKIDAKYQEAVDHGCCTNYRKCQKPAVHQAGMCADCFREYKENKRQAAIDAGRCIQFWKCDKPASQQGGMCVDCYRDYKNAKRQEAIDGDRCVNWWKCVKPATKKGGMCVDCFKSYNAEKIEIKKQEAITAGTCRNFWKCDASATRGGFCEVCFHQFKKARGEWVPIQRVVKEAAPQEAKAPTVAEFPELKCSQTSNGSPVVWPSVRPTPTPTPTPAPAPAPAPVSAS